MLSMHQLRCFLAAYEQGSLTGAADLLGYAQPSVSEQIRTLERSLGADLFTRVGRGVVPTATAESLRPYAERALEAAAGRRADTAVN
jgi:DNA-binding transcriptional LysR family regulator